MKIFYNISKMAVGILFCAISIGYTQTSNISGIVKETEKNTSLAGVNIVVKDLVIGTISNTDGEFNLEVSQAQPPFTVVFSMVGYKTQERVITDFNTS